MLKFIDSEKYKRDPRVLLHFILIVISIAVIVLGAIIYFS